jgi:hypothetical protein
MLLGAIAAILIAATASLLPAGRATDSSEAFQPLAPSANLSDLSADVVVTGVLVSNSERELSAPSGMPFATERLVIEVDSIVWSAERVASLWADGYVDTPNVTRKLPVPGERYSVQYYWYSERPELLDAEPGSPILVSLVLPGPYWADVVDYASSMQFAVEGDAIRSIGGQPGLTAVIPTSESEASSSASLPHVEDLVAFLEARQSAGDDADLVQAARASERQWVADHGGLSATTEEVWAATPVEIRDYRLESVPASELDRSVDRPLVIDMADELLDRPGAFVLRHSGGVLLSQDWRVGSHVDVGLFVRGDDVMVVDMPRGLMIDEILAGDDDRVVAQVIGRIPFEAIESSVGIVIRLLVDDGGNVTVVAESIASQEDLRAEIDRIGEEFASEDALRNNDGEKDSASTETTIR